MAITMGVQAYALAQATVRALYGDLLSQAQWEDLIRAPDYDAVLTILSKSVYGPTLQIDRALLNPRRAAYQIRLHLADIYAKLIRISPAVGQPVLMTLWHHYEVDNIRVALRGVEAGATWDQVRHLLYPMRRYVVVTVRELEQMVRSGSVGRAIDALKGTQYHGILSHALTRYEDERSLFPLEVALDIWYRRTLWDCVLALKTQDRAMALKTVGTVLDVDNLLWALRFRVYHHLTESEIINYTLSTGFEVKDADIRQIARGGDSAQAVFRAYPELRETLRGVSFDTGEGLGQLEQALLRLLISRCRHMFAGAPFHIGLPLAYVLLNEYEIRDLTLLIEAKAARTPISTFGPMLLVAAV
ncbi:MAG: V-type ATPase subunit [Anaerolineae bacterium]|jgi:vacuolar-type H+-ATPase subunit C/Vma6|nr:V-type ATPase subunit [Anaerolineae bacterium]